MYRDFCRRATLAVMKAPSTTKFVDLDKAKVGYDLYGQVYDAVFSVDSQNSFGAMLRVKYNCIGIYSGSNTKGSLSLYIAEYPKL